MNPRLGELVERAVDHALTPTEDGELLAALADPAAAAEACAQRRVALLMAALAGRPADEVAALVRAGGARRASSVYAVVSADARRRARRRLAAVAALAAAAVIALALRVRSSTASTATHGAAAAASVIAVVAEAGAGVAIDRAAGASAAVAGDELRAGDGVRGADGRAVIRVGDATRIALSPRTGIAMSGSADAPVLALRGGCVRIDAAATPPLRIATDAALVEAAGASFTVDARPGRTRVAVADGVVRVGPLGSGAPVDVAADERAIVVAGAAPIAGPDPRVRLVDDAEDGAAWRRYEHTAPLGITLVAQPPPRRGRAALRLSYAPRAGDPTPYGEAIRALRLRGDERVLRLWLRPGACAPDASWNVQFRQRDRSCWMIGDGRCDALHAGWNRIELTLPAAPELVSDDTGHGYDATAVDGVLFSLCGAAATIDVDDVALIAVDDAP